MVSRFRDSVYYTSIEDVLHFVGHDHHKIQQRNVVKYFKEKLYVNTLSDLITCTKDDLIKHKFGEERAKRIIHTVENRYGVKFRKTPKQGNIILYDASATCIITNQIYVEIIFQISNLIFFFFRFQIY